MRTAEGTVRDSRQVGQWKLRSVSPRGARSVAVLVPAEYLILSEGGRNCRIECRSARSGRPSALLDAAESCGTSRGCSRRSHGDAAVPVDDPTPEHVPLWFRDFDAPRGNERPSGHVSLFPRPSALGSEGWVALLRRARVVAIELVDLQAECHGQEAAAGSTFHVRAGYTSMTTADQLDSCRSRGAGSRSALTMLDFALRHAVPDIPG